MADWRDVMNARAESDNAASTIEHEVAANANPELIAALLALRLEIRALAMLIDYARGDAR